MKKLWILLPAWVFLLAYFFYKMKDGRNGGVRAEEGGFTKKRAEAKPGFLDTMASESETATLASPRLLPLRELEPRSGSEIDGMTAAARSELFLLPRDPEASPVSFLWPVDEDGPALPALMRHARRHTFDRWKPYSDEWISFYYPDDAGLELEVTGGEASFPMIGETMWTVQDTAFRRYVLRAGGQGTLCVISLDLRTEFDDSERFPREEVFHRFMKHENLLCRASFIDTGQVRRFQFISGEFTVSVLDWPHCALHHDVYVRMALTIAPRVATVDLDRLAAAARKLYGFDADLGFLRRGMERHEINALLGEPAGIADELMVYLRPGADGTEHYRLLEKQGRFVGFDQQWRMIRRDPPIDGTLEWMVEKTESTAGSSGAVGYDLGAVTDTDAQYIFDQFLSIGPSASEDVWDTFCRVLANLSEMKIRDPRILSVIEQRFLDPDLPQSHAIQVLHAYDAAAAQRLFAKRLQLLLRDGRWEGSPLVHGAGDVGHDLQILFAYLGKGHAGTPTLLARAMEHGDAGIRAAAYGFWEWMPAEKVTPHIVKGLGDKTPQVRRRSAEAFCEGCGNSRDHIPLLEKHLLEESDAEARNYLVEALKRLRAIEVPSADGNAGP